MGIYNKQAPGDNPGYVYLLRRGPAYKIGHTSSIFWRLKTINDVVTPYAVRQFPVEVLWKLQCADQVTTERALQQRFARYHTGTGEWFYLPDDAAGWICEQTDEAALCEGYDPKRYHRPDGRKFGRD